MKFDSDVKDPRFAGLYAPAADRERSEKGETPPSPEFLDDWLARTAELVDKYKPQLVWFDWWIAQPPVHANLQKFAAFYYNRGAEWGKGVAINYKKHGGESFPDTAGVLDIERGQLANIRPLFWQTDTSVSKTSWGYVLNHEYKTVDSIVDDLVDIVSKNGSLLLNIGPRPDGTIPEPEEAMLREIGQWLAVNGEAIYGTRPFTVYGEGPTAVIEGPFADDEAQALHGRGRPLHDQGRHALRDRARLAGGRARDHQDPGPELAEPARRDRFRGAPRGQGAGQVDPRRRRAPRRATRGAAQRSCSRPAHPGEAIGVSFRGQLGLEGQVGQRGSPDGGLEGTRGSWSPGGWW